MYKLDLDVESWYLGTVYADEAFEKRTMEELSRGIGLTYTTSDRLEYPMPKIRLIML